MRKSIKKIAATVLAAAMVVGTLVVPSTQASADEGSTYTLVGARQLGLDWDVESEALQMTNVGGDVYQIKVTVPETADSNYDGTPVAVEEGEYEFKFVEDGPIFQWANQLQYGTGLFQDNATQFNVKAAAGDEIVYTINVATGEVIITNNGAAAEVNCKWDTRSEWDGDWCTLAEAMQNYVVADAEVLYSVVGDAKLSINWAVDNAEYFATTADGTTYTKTLVVTEDSDDLQFKIVQDGPTFSWANQLQLGTGEFLDNASQFKLAGVVGDVFVVSFDPSTGDVSVTKNGEDYDYLVRWDTREEADADFLTKAEALAKFVPETEDPTEEDTTAEEEDTTVAEEETTTVAETTVAATTAAETTTASNASTKTGDAAPIAVLVSLLGAVAVIAVVAKKKEA